MEAHILADLAFQAASLGDSSDGIVIGEAAARVAERCPASVHASVLSRAAFAYAAAGRVDDCQRIYLDAQARLVGRPTGHEPSWMYYLTSNHLDCQAGYAMILAGRRRGADGRRLLRQGETLPRSGAHARPLEDPSQRRALYEGAWLALSYTAHGKYDDAADVTRMALPRLGRVRSPRSVALLEALATDLRRRRRNPTVADLLPEVEAAIAPYQRRG